MKNKALATGAEVFLREKPKALRNKRLGLLTHPAGVDGEGLHLAERLWHHPDYILGCLMGPEHGYGGEGGAGEEIGDTTHAEWGIPVFSLYGETRAPTSAMWENLDVLLVDFQTIPARFYTYISTLRYVLEGAAETGKPVVVLDRPVPLPKGVDGPMMDPELETFVGCVNMTSVYGLTPGEAAVFLKQDLNLDLDLRVLQVKNYQRQARPLAGLDWIPPSPAIRSWDCAECYPATVWVEAFPALDAARSSPLAFQVLGGEGWDQVLLTEQANELALPGIQFHPMDFHEEFGSEYQGVSGLRIQIHDPNVFRPVCTGVSLLCLVRDLFGEHYLWDHPDARELFFNQLMGTSSVLMAMKEGADPKSIAAGWEQDVRAFNEKRESVIMYP